MKLKWRYLLAKSSIFILFGVITMLQIFSFPGQFRHMKNQGAIKFWQELLLTGLLAAILFAAQLVLFSLWKILILMEGDDFFSIRTLNWFNKIVKSIGFALISAGLLLLAIFLQADDPGGPVLFTAITIFISTPYLLSSLLREQIKIKVSDN